jgi:transcription elongation factor Elf1
MTEVLLEQQVQCPYCGESYSLLLDVSAGEQRYVEDCAVCCRPIECRLVQRGGAWSVEVRRDDD